MFKDFVLGNEAIALALVNNGLHSAYSYPGTPASEILPAIEKFSDGQIYTQWSINEKVALEIAAAEAISGKYSCCSMKQVGLNVAADPLFSIAYTGITGSLTIVSADDPELNSSQTAQDSRMYAYMAGIPVFDPANPKDAYKLTCAAVNLSEKYEIPVIVRPVEKVCHSRQSMDIEFSFRDRENKKFVKDVNRWAATPIQRRVLKKALYNKLNNIAFDYYKGININKNSAQLIIASGHPFAIVNDLIKELNYLNCDLLKLDLVFPIPQSFIESVLCQYNEILILEETYPLVELQFSDRNNVMGKLNDFYEKDIFLSIDNIYEILHRFLKKEKKLYIESKETTNQHIEKPKLCPGCPHRGAFYAIKKAFKEAIYAGDIGCYTLGINLRALDTCICMGASISFAEGLKRANIDKPVIAEIGDSTFFHTGLPPLINAYLNNTQAVICILDNITTAMTGFQRVPHERNIDLMEKVIKAIGVDFVKILDPYDIKSSIDILKEAHDHCKIHKNLAVLIFRRGCVLKEKTFFNRSIEITDKCVNCGTCYKLFECPAIKYKNTNVFIDRNLCINCGLCISICPKGAIVEK
jgi:indolepyruvate ferredoxin oxidoreductase alpha subunit